MNFSDNKFKMFIILFFHWIFLLKMVVGQQTIWWICLHQENHLLLLSNLFFYLVFNMCCEPRALHIIYNSLLLCYILGHWRPFLLVKHWYFNLYLYAYRTCLQFKTMWNNETTYFYVLPLLWFSACLFMKNIWLF